MALVQELYDRGGITKRQFDEYAKGATLHEGSYILYEDIGVFSSFNYEKMGVPLREHMAWLGGGSWPTRSVTSYSKHGSVTTTSLGGGVTMTSGTRTVRTVR
jgi:hypothetical protein